MDQYALGVGEDFLCASFPFSVQLTRNKKNRLLDLLIDPYCPIIVHCIWHRVPIFRFFQEGVQSSFGAPLSQKGSRELSPLTGSVSARVP